MADIDLESFREAVAQAVASCNVAVMEAVKEEFAQEEVARLKPIFKAGILEEIKLTKSLGKFKPENMYNEAGEVVSTYWTQAALQNKKKAEDALARVSDGLRTFLASGNIQPLEKALKSAGQGGGDGKPEPAGE